MKVHMYHVLQEASQKLMQTTIFAARLLMSTMKILNNIGADQET